MKGLSVLGSKLLDQVLQGCKLSPVDKVELLQEQNISFLIGYLSLLDFFFIKTVCMPSVCCPNTI